MVSKLYSYGFPMIFLQFPKYIDRFAIIHVIFLSLQFPNSFQFVNNKKIHIYSYGFPIIFLWFPNDIPIVSQLYIDRFAIIHVIFLSLQFPNSFQFVNYKNSLYSYDFPMIFLQFPNQSPIVSQLYIDRFPIIHVIFLSLQFPN